MALIGLVGDSVLNLTYRARPPGEGYWSTPFTFLNEEYLEFDPVEGSSHTPDSVRLAHAEASIQGTAYIARQIARASADTIRPLVLTGISGPDCPPSMSEALERLVALGSSLSMPGPYRVPIVVRLLRDVSSSHSKGRAADLRPQLRIDRATGEPPNLDAQLDDFVMRLEKGDTVLLRTITRDFLARSGDGSATEMATAARLARFQGALKRRGVTLVLDLRVWPKQIAIESPTTVISTTVSRLRELLVLPSTVAESDVVERAFWRLSPCAALICFAGAEGTFLCVRKAEDPRTGERHVLPFSWPSNDPDGCGLVIGGDAYVAALVLSLSRAPSDFPAAIRAAGGALRAAIQLPIGSPVSTASQLIALDPAPISVQPVAIEDPKGRLLGLALKSIECHEDPRWHGVIAPAGGRLRAELTKVEVQLSKWKSQPGRDLLAVMGESRCGKEYPLKALLKSLGWCLFGPINMDHFLKETANVLKALNRSDENQPETPILAIDEVAGGEMSRSLLNLMAEKVYRPYDKATRISFSKWPIILMSSINPTDLLADLRGRLHATIIEIPPLRERQLEIPYLLPISLEKGEGADWVPPQRLGVTLDLLSALLNHDYRADPTAGSEAGLDKQNFRAFEDLLAYLYGRWEVTLPRPAEVLLGVEHLPGRLRLSSPHHAVDARALWYTRAGTAWSLPLLGGMTPP